jgi:membrane protein implicated in regulation of membrane protease activity
MMFFVYMVCFGVGLLFTVISAFMAEVFGGDHGGGHDAHHEIGTDGHAEVGYNMPGFSAFSPTVVTSFVTAFGGFGMIFTKIEATQSPWISAPLSILIALVIAAGVLWLFQEIFHRTQGSSESHVVSLVGQTVTIITPIPENGVGEIAYVQGGTRYSAPARAEDGASVRNGQTVKVTRVVGSQFYVTPF